MENGKQSFSKKLLITSPSIFLLFLFPFFFFFFFFFFKFYFKDDALLFTNTMKTFSSLIEKATTGDTHLLSQIKTFR